MTGMGNYAQHHLFLTISESFIKIKSHTYEEGGTHIRISVWHLLMSFEKPESEFWITEKTLLDVLSFYTCVPKSTIIWGTVSEIQNETKNFVILGHFLPFYPTIDPEN